MNTLASYIMTSPQNIDEECSRFEIDDITNAFVLFDIATVDEPYTFSAWIRSDGAGSLTVGEETFSVTSQWAKHTTTFTASSVDISLWFGEPGVYYLYHPQLENGTVPTDWTPAPEDFDQVIDDVTNTTHNLVVEQNTSIINNCSELILSALESYVETSDYDGFKRDVESRLAVMANEIRMSFTSTEEQISDVDGEMQMKFTELYKYISFSTDGIVIGDNGGITLSLDNNNGIVFSKNGIVFGRWDGENFYTGNIVVEVNERAQFGNFAYVPRSDGSLSFLKIV